MILGKETLGARLLYSYKIRLVGTKRLGTILTACVAD
jgi:hypothetical protein